MKDNANKENENKKESFFAKVFEKLDKKMEKKAKSRACCSSSSGKEKNSCCS